MRLRAGTKARRGAALIMALLAVALLMTILAVLVNVATVRLRRSTQDLRSVQAVAAADAGAGWVRAILNQRYGDMPATLADLAAAHSTLQVRIDSGTSATVLVSVQVPASSSHSDHLDKQLQVNPQILEAPAQVVATASVYAGASLQSTRTVTTLLRTFHRAPPYSEVVGVIDNGGPVSVDSPGDPAGQLRGAYSTELRLHAAKENSGSQGLDKFQDERWADTNSGSTGFLP